MKLVISILGAEVFSIEISSQDGAQALADAISGLVDDDDEKAGIGAGHTHNFERDADPPDALGEVPWSEYEDKGGFGFS